ncbi:hypothetical protein [Natronobacterium gregoryi]|uniref:Uncharacterized protein n=2 Tax=Natronobacterium gregoryi TaxID=44930 RepID=L0AD22_NATGS|nr:hypothetical protein [Natronobacterium gregoryi]AFZ71329.1 hypothetical protein Natgr_0060 [Natronobacterium gregoryi SP2]ELY67031.1 hypothetical protein C490_11451 [Natronobacterium gregoryi SP2]PLK18464.1 hypothetical protein CYV19_17845 [Natronobacterium gregoryi SP2]SFJ70425.1 hypothetical protein SAMN05443661_1615 [Natronobacterium gregoryi]
MTSRQQIQERDVSGQATEEISEQAIGPAFLASAASVGLAWYYFFLRGDRERGLFVGLWPPTILAFASYFNQRKMRQQLDSITQPGATLKNAIDSMMGSR